MLHGPAVELGEDKSSKYKSKLGLILFFVYFVVYAVFVYIGISHTSLLEEKLFGGLNLAVIYGYGLIILAIIMGVVYHLFCTKYEKKYNKEE